MKQFLLFICLLVFVAGTQAQSDFTQRFLKHKKQINSTNSAKLKKEKHFKSPKYKGSEGYYFPFYDIENNTWPDSSRFEYIFDAKGNITKEDVYNNENIVARRYEYDYDQYNNMVEERYYQLEGQSNMLELFSLNHDGRFYDNLGRIIKYESMFYSQSQDTTYFYYSEYQYKQDSLIINYHNFNSELGEYEEVASFQEIYTLKNSKGEFAKYQVREFDGTKYKSLEEGRNLIWNKLDFNTDTYELISANFYEYNELGLAIETARLSGNYTQSKSEELEETKVGISYVPSYRYTIEYDFLKNVTRTLSESYENNQWVVDYESKYIYQYDGDKVTQEIYQIPNFISNELINYSRRDFTNHVLVNSVKQQAKNAVLIYPNPMQNELNINNLSGEWSELSLINIAGKTIKKAALNNSKTKIDVSLLPAGIYLLQLSNAQSISTQKIIKE